MGGTPKFPLGGVLVPTVLRGNAYRQDLASFRRPLAGAGDRTQPAPRALALGFIPSPPLGAGDMAGPFPRASLHVVPLHPGLYSAVPYRGLTTPLRFGSRANHQKAL